MAEFRAIVVTAMLLWNGVSAQDEESLPFKRVLIGPVFSPEFAYRTLVNRFDSTGAETIIGLRDDIETVKFGYTTGISIQVNLTRSIGLGGGIFYADRGFQSQLLELNPIQTGDPHAPASTRYVEGFHYLEFPVILIGTFRKGRLRFTAAAGASFGLLKGTYRYSILHFENGETVWNEENPPIGLAQANRFNFYPMVSAGIDYRFHPMFGLKVEPIFRFGVLRVSDTPVTALLWNAGFVVSIYVAFGK